MRNGVRELTETSDKEGGTKGGYNKELELEEREDDLRAKEEQSARADRNQG